MSTPVLPTPAETVAVAWLRTGPTAGAGTATVLPKDPLAWPLVGTARIFTQVTDVSGTPDVYTGLRESLLQWDVWAVQPSSNRARWDAASATAGILLQSLYAPGCSRDLSAELPPQYAASRVLSAWPVGTPRRIPDDPSGYARYTLDVRMAWIMLSDQDIYSAIPYTEA